MSIGIRIKRLRRYLDLTQQEFADRIGVKRNTIANYEAERNNPVDSVVALICREFSACEEWLRTGEGEMFAPAPSTALDALARERGLSHGAYIAIEKFLNLSPEIQNGIIGYFTEVAAALNADDVSSSAQAAPALASEEELHAELDRQLAAEKMEKEESGAS